MLISVEPGSLEWHTGIWVAAQCKKTLEDFNIKDIEVEIKESRVDIEDSEDEIEESNITGAGQLFVPPPHEFEAKVPVPQTPFLGLPDDLFYKNECIKKKIQISRHLGTQIFPEGNKQAGTKGLYLQVMLKNAKSPVFLALTCRHFVFTENSDTNLGGSEYLCTPQKSKIWMNQQLQNRYKGIKNQIDYTVAGLDELRRELTEAIEKSDQLKAKISDASLIDSDYSDLKQIQKHLARYEGESSRRFGHVVYAAAQSTAPAGWLRNYALISLGADAHNGRIPRNTVWAPQVFSGCDVEYLMDTWGDRNTWGYDWPNQPTTIELSGHLTLQQIRSPDKYLKDAQTMGDDKDQLIVGMVGARSDWRGTRFGIVNNVQSLTRHVTKGDSCRELISMEVCVTSMERSCFSTNMDSGACVWSLDGRVVGIVAGYTSADPFYADITYVTTLENIIADLKNAGLDASLYRLPE